MKALKLLFLILFPFSSLNAQWVKLNDFPSISVSDMVADNGILYASNNNSMPQGIFRSVNGGVNWTPISPSLPAAKKVSDMLLMPEGLWAATLDGIYFTSDQGITWIKRSNGLPNASGWEFIFAYGINNVNGALYASIDRGIYRSTDNGDSWTSAHAAGLHFYCRDIVGLNGNIFAGKYTIGTSGFGALYRSSNNGINWGPANYGSGGSINSYTLVNDGTRIYAGTSDGVFMTSDGVTWTDRNNGLSFDTHVNSIVRKGSTLFASENESGVVFRSSNDGQSWLPVPDTLEVLNEINRLVLDGNTLYAASSYGIWKIPVQDMMLTGVQSISSTMPEGFSLRQNYPNPFNPQTKIEFSIPENGHVKLTVYDITGKEVSSLVNNVMQAGTYSADFNGSGLTSGVYFFRLQASSFNDVKKMILSK